MPKRADRNREKRGFNLQCLWSKLFPQLYEHSREPCALTPFATFRELTDHIWKYHSYLLSCSECDYRFLSAKRREEHWPELDELKNRHIQECHPNFVGGNAPHANGSNIITMKEYQDESLRNWKQEKRNNIVLPKESYISLCYCLWGSGITAPNECEYTYLVPEYKTNELSASQGERNIEYARLSNSGIDLASRHQPENLISYNPQLSHSAQQSTIYPLSLDESRQPEAWGLAETKPDQDSGYASGPKPVDNVMTGAEYGEAGNSNETNFIGTTIGATMGVTIGPRYDEMDFQYTGDPFWGPQPQDWRSSNESIPETGGSSSTYYQLEENDLWDLPDSEDASG
ncbi:hypothetical protein F4777DRAFT_111811 [Nemania sp. FL0916]|nr:hypothetical protein F4777DRAFT_111811 [Nemania sp. FL0916]